MKTTYKERYNKMQLIKKETPTHHNTAKQDILTMFRLLPRIPKPDYEPQFIDPHCHRDAYWKKDLHDQEKFEYNLIFKKPPERIEDDCNFTDSQVSNKPRHALIDLWTVNQQLLNI